MIFSWANLPYIALNFLFRMKIKSIEDDPCVCTLPMLKWIHNFDFLRKLVVRLVLIADRDSDYEVFIFHSMYNLRHFEIDRTCFAFYSDVFLMEIKNIFPKLDTFIIGKSNFPCFFLISDDRKVDYS